MSKPSSAAFIARKRSAVLMVPMASTRCVPSSTMARPWATASTFVANTLASTSAAAIQASMSLRSSARRGSIRPSIWQVGACSTRSRTSGG